MKSSKSKTPVSSIKLSSDKIKKAILLLLFIASLMALTVMWYVLGWVGGLLIAILFVPVPIGFVIVEAVSCLVIFLLWKPFNKKKILLGLAMPFILVLSSIVLAGLVSRALFYKYTAMDLAPVITALDSYKNDKGAYPQQLDELVPTYLKQVPSLWGANHQRPGYVIENNEYSLEFGQSTTMYCYRSDSQAPTHTRREQLVREWFDCMDFADTM